MPAKTVDASALAALVFGEPEAERIADRIRGASLVAPALLPFEMASACLNKIRRHPGSRDALISAFAMFERMDIVTVAIDFVEVLALAERTRLTAYDASYLWLAEALDAELVTLDKPLAAAFASSRRG